MPKAKHARRIGGSGRLPSHSDAVRLADRMHLACPLVPKTKHTRQIGGSSRLPSHSDAVSLCCACLDIRRTSLQQQACDSWLQFVYHLAWLLQLGWQPAVAISSIEPTLVVTGMLSSHHRHVSMYSHSRDCGFRQPTVNHTF